MMKRHERQRGMSLVETLVAGMILSATVVTVSALSTRSMSGAIKNRSYEKAASLIDRQLTFIEAIGIDTFLEIGQSRGEFGDLAPDYTWEATTKALSAGYLYEVCLTVYWPEGGTIKKQSVTTRMNGQEVAIDDM